MSSAGTKFIYRVHHALRLILFVLDPPALERLKLPLSHADFEDLVGQNHFIFASRPLSDDKFPVEPYFEYQIRAVRD
jgi:hypothetical protein